MPTPTTYNTQYELYNVDFKRGDVRHFTSEAQRSEYFDESHLIDSGTLNSYIRVDQDFKIDKTYADIREANYCRYNNGDGDGWRYAYITRMEVVSTSCTRLYIQQDPWQNNMFNFEIHGTRLRGHVDRLVKNGSSYNRLWSFTPEDIGTSTIAEAVDYSFNNLSFIWYVFSEAPVDNPALKKYNLTIDGLYYMVVPFVGYPKNMTIESSNGSVIGTLDIRVLDTFENSPYLVNKFYSSTTPSGTNITYNASTDTARLGDSGGVFSTAFITTTMAEGGTLEETSYETTILYFVRSTFFDWDSPLNAFEDLGIPNQITLTTIPSPSDIRSASTESKLFCSPFTFHKCGIGQEQIEVFNELMDQDSPTAARVFIAPSAAGLYALLAYPEQYNSNVARVRFKNVPISKTATVRRDTENTYLAANEERMTTQVIGGLASIIVAGITAIATGGVSLPLGAAAYAGGQTIRNAYALSKDLANAPDTININGDVSQVMITDSQRPYRITYAPAADDFDRLYSYFYTYGYTINEWQNIPNTQIRTRYYFDYYLFGDDVHCDVQDSATARELMEEDLRKGVTFWHWNETTNGFQHTRENLEMSLITN